MRKISIVIPVYNSESTIKEVAQRLIETINKTKYEYEIILVNDNSKDNTLKECKQLVKENGKIKLINFSKNFGQHHALMAGLRLATGHYIVCMDDDLQTVPEELPKLVYELEKGGYDIVYASYQVKKHSWFRNIGSAINDMMLEYLINKPKCLKVSSYFIARRFVICEIVKYDKPYPYILGLVLRITDNIGNVLIEHNKRKIGKSNYSFKKLIRLWLNGFTNFSVRPLRLASLLGVLFAFIGFLFIIIIVIQKIVTPETQLGWTSTMTSIVFFGGIQLMTIGLLGEYIGRIYLSINKTPQYVIKEMFIRDN